MILLDTATDTLTKTTSKKSDAKDSHSFSFADLLSSLSNEDEDIKLQADDAKNSSTPKPLLELQEDTKEITPLQTTKQTDKKDTKKEESSFLESFLQSNTLKDIDLEKLQEVEEKIENPKTPQTKEVEFLKQIIFDAKKSLQKEIEALPEYKQAQIKEMPKTLSGLVKMAKTFNIDLSKISLTQGTSKQSQQTTKEQPKPSPLPKDITPKATTKLPFLKTNLQTQQTPSSSVEKTPKKQVTLQDMLQTKTPPKQEKQETTQPLKTQETSKEPQKIQTEIKTTPQAQQEIQKSPKEEVIQTKQQPLKPTTFNTTDKKTQEITLQTQPMTKEVTENKTEQLKKPQDIQTTISTQEQKIKTTPKVETKIETKVKEPTQPKEKEKLTSIHATQTTTQVKQTQSQEQSSNQNQNFSSQTTSQQPQVQKTETKVTNFASLLNSVKEEDEPTQTKAETTSTHKVEQPQQIKNDQLDQKIHEAKQMVRYLSQDVKENIQNYKSPFTRVKLQLNPQNLGEMDLTIVQRGNNLHVSLQSNNHALNLLNNNLQDLKTQFQNNGINNATFDFNSSSQEQQREAAQQQQNQQRAKQHYQDFEEFNEDEEIITSLEITIPNYA